MPGDDRHFRFPLPDAVADLAAAGRQTRSWGNDVLLRVAGVGCFLRVLLAVALDDGTRVTYGVWLAVSEQDFARAWESWEQPAYRGLVVEGWLANAIEPWGQVLLGAPARAAVHRPDELPVLDESAHSVLAGLLDRVWPRDQVLGPLPD